MKSADYVTAKIEEWKKAQKPLIWIAWNVALLCVGWAYVFGARGELCTPANRRAYFKSKGAAHPTIATKCQVIRPDDPKASCNGCKWYPDKKRVRCFDCRGFTDWCLLQYGIDLLGEGATSQWNNAKNWEQKGLVSDGVPKGVLVCLFYKEKSDPSKMAHTGFGYNGATCECSSGVQKFDMMNSKWTHWAIPAGIREKPEPTPVPPEPKPEKGTAIITGKNLALRQGPTTDSAVIARYATGTTVKIEKVPDDWEYVDAKGRKGFMMKKFLNEG